MKPILERLSDSLPNLGADAASLLAFKQHCGLPTDQNVVELDPVCCMYLDAAEKFVDEITGCPLRLRSYQYSMSCLPKCGPFYTFYVPRYPVNPTTTLTWSADDGTSGTYTEDTEYKVFGRTTLKPQLVFSSSSFVPKSAITLPYPFVFYFTCGPSKDASIHKVAIFELASFYYRFPEAMTDKNPNVGPVFQSNLDFLMNSFL